MTVDTEPLWKSKGQFTVVFQVCLWRESYYSVFWETLSRDHRQGRGAFLPDLAKCVLHYDTITSVSNYLSNSTNVESEANNKVHLYVTDVFQGIILNLLNTHNYPVKKKLKITKWEDRDFDMLMGISSWCFLQHGQNHLLACRPVPPSGESPRSS